MSDMRPKAHIPLDPRHVPFSAMCRRVRVMPRIDQKMSTILEAT